jgi:hypothetical protein
MDGLIEIIGGLLSIYFLFDFFLWNGGLVNPSILQRISEATAILLA